MHTHSPALKSILAERKRQQDDKGHSLKDDLDHNLPGTLALAGAALAAQTGTLMRHPDDAVPGISAPTLWPFPPETYKDRGRRQNLVVAGAFLLAELERYDADPANQG